MNLTELIKGNTATIDRYRAQHIYYNIAHEGVTYTFPVPLEDVQEATLNQTEKAITLMRYIRKSLNDNTFIRAVI